MNTTIAENMMRRIAIGDCLRRSMRRYEKKIAVIDGDRKISYKELNHKSNQFANGLLAKKLAKGTKIAFVSSNCLEFFIVYYGATKAGMVIVPINPMFKSDEMAYCVNNADCEVFVFNGQFHKMLEEVFPKFEKVKHFITYNSPSNQFEDLHKLISENSTEEPEVFITGDDVAEILFTGGTTSFPRGAQLTHQGIFACATGVLVDHSYTHHDVMLAVMPLFHVACFISCIWTHIVGGTVVTLPTVDMGKILATIEKEKITSALLLSTLWRGLLNHPDFAKYDLSSLRLATYFGAVMPEDLLKECMNKMCKDWTLHFGQTEMSPSVTVFKPEDQLRKISSLGNSSINAEIAVMDDAGKLLPPREIGEFVYRGPQVMKGYYNNDEENEKAFRYGWFHSGDLGYLDDDGYVYFVDRKKDMIKSGGENVASIEVEKTIYLDPRVQEVQVLGLPHLRWGEAITAFIMPKPGQSIKEEEIIALCKDKLAGFKVPKKIVVVSDFPRTSTGKVLKRDLRQKYQDMYKREI